MAERSNAAVLKTVDGQLSGGSNPSLSATKKEGNKALFFLANEPNIERDSRVEMRAGASSLRSNSNTRTLCTQTKQRTPAVCRGASA